MLPSFIVMAAVGVLLICVLICVLAWLQAASSYSGTVLVRLLVRLQLNRDQIQNSKGVTEGQGGLPFEEDPPHNPKRKRPDRLLLFLLSTDT